MRLIPLFVAVAAAFVLFLSAPMISAFKTTQDYIQRCNTQSPSEACKMGFRFAALKLAAEDQGKYCDPSERADGRARGDAGWTGEIPRIATWLASHPQPPGQGYMDSLGIAMVAVYPCK